MAKRSNKEIEHYYFEMFRRDYQLPEGTVIYPDKPDVIIEGKRNIGIEITNFYHERGALPESEQAQRKARKRVISEAQKAYLANGGKKIELSFSFDPESPILNRRILVNKIVTLAKTIEEFTTGSIRKDSFKYIPELSFVYLNVEEYEDPQWRMIPCCANPLMSLEELCAIVNAKEVKSKHYRHCEAYWLVIVVDSLDTAQNQEIQIDGFAKIDSAVFEKVIVYKTYFGHVLEAK